MFALLAVVLLRLGTSSQLRGSGDSLAALATENDEPPMSELLGGADWPAKGAYDESFKAAMYSGNMSAPCAATILGRYRLNEWGMGAHINTFAEEVFLAMYLKKPFALCTPPNVRDQLSNYYQDPGFALRCKMCDWEVGPRQYALPDMKREVKLYGSEEKLKHEEALRFVYQKLFRLRGDVQMAVNESLQNLRLPGTYVGVHVRRGDKASEYDLIPMEKLVAAARQMCSDLGTRTVFVASDSKDSRGELQRGLGSDYTVVEQPRIGWDKAYRLRGDVARDASSQYKDLMVDEEHSLLIDIAALINSAGFVGAGSSNIGRVVFLQRPQGAPAVNLDTTGDFITGPDRPQQVQR